MTQIQQISRTSKHTGILGSFSGRIPDLSCVDHNVPIQGRHVYRYYDIIVDPSKVFAILSKGKTLVPVSVAGKQVKVSLKNYLKQLVEFENSANKQNSRRYLHSLDVVLDRNCTEEQAKGLVDELRKVYNLTNETYFARYYTIKDRRYVCLYMSERTFYKEAQDFDVVYTSDFYIDPVTKRRLGKNAPGGIYLHRKGDVIRTEKRHFSPKSGVLKMGPSVVKARSYQVLEAVKNYYNANHIGQDTYLLPRLDYHDFRGNKRMHLKAINGMFQTMEKAMNDAASKLSSEYLDDYKKSFKELVLSVRDCVDKDDCVISKNVRIGALKKHRTKVVIDYNKRVNTIVYAMELFVDDFMDKLANAVNKIYEVFGVVTAKDWRGTMSSIGLNGIESQFTYKCYVWNESMIPKDRKLSDAQRYFLWNKNGRVGRFVPKAEYLHMRA